MSITAIKNALRRHADKKQAKLLQRFFKTGPGEYAEGDVFLGVKVPVVRGLAAEYRDVPLRTAVRLLRSAVHEERLLALFIIIGLYRKAGASGQRKIYRVYLDHARYINNWDLVDVTAKHIVGAFLADKDKAPLYKLAGSDRLWERRIAVLSTFHFIERGSFDDALNIAGILLGDRHDLIHKATGWMLREVGKRDMRREEEFLKKYCAVMPRTMLRYAIERFPQAKRRAYLVKKRKDKITDNRVFYCRRSTPFGPVFVMWSAWKGKPGVIRVSLSGKTPGFAVSSCAPVNALADGVAAFLRGKDVRFSLEALRFDLCSVFQRKILRAQYAVPRGSVSTYRRLAKRAGNPRAVRAVGAALASNPFPFIIPCHRTIRSDGGLGGYQGGLKMKRTLLEMEGVRIPEKK